MRAGVEVVIVWVESTEKTVCFQYSEEVEPPHQGGSVLTLRRWLGGGLDR